MPNEEETHSGDGRSDEEIVSPDFTDLVNRINRDLEELNRTNFSNHAFNRIRFLILEFIGNLVRESVIVSERHGTDVVSRLHVDIANAYLISHSKRKYVDMLMAIGGAFLGTALSGLYILITNSPIDIKVVIFTFVCGILGVILIAVNISKEI